MTVTMTKPDGTTQIYGPFNSDSVGGCWTSFVPDQVGIYKFVGNFPTQSDTRNSITVAARVVSCSWFDFINDPYMID
jgi:hypothetical protein